VWSVLLSAIGRRDNEGKKKKVVDTGHAELFYARKNSKRRSITKKMLERKKEDEVG